MNANEDDSATVSRFTDYVAETWVEGSIPKISWNHDDSENH